MAACCTHGFVRYGGAVNTTRQGRCDEHGLKTDQLAHWLIQRGVPAHMHGPRQACACSLQDLLDLSKVKLLVERTEQSMHRIGCDLLIQAGIQPRHLLDTPQQPCQRARTRWCTLLYASPRCLACSPSRASLDEVPEHGI